MESIRTRGQFIHAEVSVGWAERSDAQQNIITTYYYYCWGAPRLTPTYTFCFYLICADTKVGGTSGFGQEQTLNSESNVAALCTTTEFGW